MITVAGLNGVELNDLTVERLAPGNPRKGLIFTAKCKIGAFSPKERSGVLALWTILELKIGQSRKPTKRRPEEIEVLATINASHVAELALAGNIDGAESRDDFKKFAEESGESLIYPYLSEFVADMVRRLGFPPLYVAFQDLEFEYLDLEQFEQELAE